MEKNQPRKLQRLMIRPIVSEKIPVSNLIRVFIVPDLQVFPNEGKSRGVAS